MVTSSVASPVLLTVFCLLALPDASSARDVYMDKYGHCQAREDFSLEEEEVTLRHVGGGLPHETLICSITFKARDGRGVCIHFHQLSIRDCGVTLKIFQRSTASGSYWRRFQCNEDKPKKMCTPERYVTIVLEKESMNQNKNYEVELLLKENDSLTDDNVLFVSIGIYVGIIIGVIALIAFVAVLAICCCCRKKKGRRSDGYKAPPSSSGPPAAALQPSAPVLEFPDLEMGGGPGGHMYHTVPSIPLDHPPPYEPSPPPYSDPPHDPCPPPPKA